MTDKRILMSIIMPVYNSAEFLETTLMSVLGSQAEDLELIAVNDGSTDNSLEILENYQNTYSNFYVFNQKNQGPSAARNLGLQHAKGEFVFFLDSDDLLEVNVLRDMCEKANEQEADLVIASYDIFNEFRKFAVPSINTLSSRKMIPWNARGILWTFSLCNKLFRRSRIVEWNMKFPKTNYSEDGVFVMYYVYHASKIIGYNEIVFHYRRMTNAENKSITSSVNETKVKDYLLSHEMIYDMLREKCLEEYPDYDDFEVLKEECFEVNDYTNEFLKKEINILFNQFYKLFWSLEESVIELIVENITRLLHRLDLKTYYDIAANMPELILENLPKSWEEAKSTANITVIFYADVEQIEEVQQSLISLTLQRYIPYIIVVPSVLKDSLQMLEINRQIIYIDAKSKEDFYEKAISGLKTKYLLFADSKFVYEKSALLELYKLCEKMQLDFITATIYMKSEEQSFPNSAQGRALLNVKNYRCGNKIEEIDSIIGNKLINAYYFKSVYHTGRRIDEISKDLFKNGYFAVTEKCYIVYEEGDEQRLLTYLTSRNIKIKKDNIEDLSLNDSRFLVDQVELYKKLRTSKLKKDKWKRDFIYKVSQMPVRDRVFFFSIRRNDELDDNLKCVEEAVKGKKVISAKMLPHDNLYKLKMYYYIATSKIIVTDDYVRYLRLFPLKSNQRVIQLWHACGAFKKFGIQGTTLSLGLERATHIQYNLVSVSSEGIRQTYANAFDIDISNVAALGVPRTDLFFNKNEISRRCEKIYAMHPEWRGKEIILYAPTFRDRSGDRSVFKPELNFKGLSEKLLDNQIFIIAPHPVMKERILSEEYSNIFEVRDIHTIDLMFISDQLVTDYSSVIFEYSLLKKPMVFFCYDLDIYDRGFYLSYDESLPGKIVRNQEDLVSYLNSEERHELSENYDQFVEKYMGACDGKSTARIAKLIDDYLGE